VEALIHRIKHMNPRARQTRVNFGDVPIAQVFDLKGFNLNAKLEIDPEFLKADEHEHDHHGHDHDDTKATTTSTARTATIRTTMPTTTT
jgi:G3E family GTPase